MIALAGLDAMRFLDSKDSFERNLMVSIADRVHHLQQVRDRNLAVRIVNGVGKLFGG